MNPDRAAARLAWAWPTGTVCALVALWALATGSGAVADYLLPGPGKVLAAIGRSAADGTLLTHLAPTLSASLAGAPPCTTPCTWGLTKSERGRTKRRR